ncbi:MAG: hypothetical protein AAGB29_13635 [Planctomycetota bacterium]
MEASAQDQLNDIVSDFERRLGDLRDAQQLLIRQLETDKVVLETQMKERGEQLERERAEIAAERKQVQAERAELDRVWHVVRQLNETMATGPSQHDGHASGASPDESASVDGHGDGQTGEAQPATDHDGWSVRYAA